jgi:general secretion pathway protein J
MTLPARDTSQSGFTLIEVLTAVVVLGLLVLTLSQGVRTGLALRQKQADRVEQNSELGAAMRLIRNVMTRIPAWSDSSRAAPGAVPSTFRGEPDSVSFVGNLPTGLGASRRAEITLFVRDGSLILSWRPRRHVQSWGSQQQPAETELIKGVARLELAYWAPPRPDQSPGWMSHWEEEVLPQVIRVRPVFPENNRRQLPDMIVAPRP